VELNQYLIIHLSGDFSRAYWYFYFMTGHCLNPLEFIQKSSIFYQSHKPGLVKATGDVVDYLG
jgi:hypothetical protein